MKNSEKPQRTRKGLSQTNLILIIGFVLVICVGVVGFLVVNSKEAPQAAEPVIIEVPQESDKNAILVDESNLESAKEAEKEKTPTFTTEMTMIWNFKNTDSTNIHMGNSSSNEYPMYFELKIPETNEVIYTSSLIPVGQKIKEVKLEKELGAGNHEVICVHHMVDEEGNDIGEAAFGLTLAVE